MYKDQVIIIGAGIAGLSFAIQLAENNIACIVLEERHNFDGPTSGVRISAEGVRVLEKMKIKNIGKGTERIIMHHGSIVTDFASSDADGRSPAIIVSRSAVHEKLIERAKLLGVEIITGFKVLNAIEYSDKVEVISEGGQSFTGKYLVGADGVGSTIRKILNPKESSGKAYAGYFGVGLITPSDAKIEMSIYQNPDNTVGVASIGRVHASDINNNVFLWTHLHMPKEDAKKMTSQMVFEMIETKSKCWPKD